MRSRLFTALNLLPSMATMDCENRSSSRHQDELAAYVAYRATFVAAEVGDGLEVWRKPLGQPHELHIVLRFALQAPAGLDAIEVAVDVDLQQYRGVGGRSPSGRRVNTYEAETSEIEFVHEDLDDADRVVLSDVVVQALGQQRDLRSIFAFDESLHVPAPTSRCDQYRQQDEFSHGLDPLPPVSSSICQPQS